MRGFAGLRAAPGWCWDEGSLAGAFIKPSRFWGNPTLRGPTARLRLRGACSPVRVFRLFRVVGCCAERRRSCRSGCASVRLLCADAAVVPAPRPLSCTAPVSPPGSDRRFAPRTWASSRCCLRDAPKAGALWCPATCSQDSRVREPAARIARAACLATATSQAACLRCLPDGFGPAPLRRVDEDVSWSTL